MPRSLPGGIGAPLFLAAALWVATLPSLRGSPGLEMVSDVGLGPVMDVAVERQLAVAIGNGTLFCIDVSQPDQPKRLGELGGLGSVRQVDVRDGVAYVSSRQDGLFIINVSNPNHPSLLFHYDTVEFATGLALSGDILFVACRNYGVELVDVSDPRRPAHISLVRTGEAQSVVARDSYLYAGVWATSEVVTVDVHDPARPKIVSRVPLDGYGDGVDIEGNYLYASTGHHSKEQPRKNPGDPGFGKGHGLEIFHLDDPAKPAFVSRVKFPPLYEIGNDMWGVQVVDGHAFVADTWNGAFLVDVQDPKQPRTLSRLEVPGSKDGKRKGFVGGLALVDGHVLIAGGYSDLHVAASSVAKPLAEDKDDAPEGRGVRGVYETPGGWRSYRPGGQVYGVAFFEDGRAAVACGDQGMTIMKLWPEFEELVAMPTEGFAMDVAVSGQTMLVAESAGGLSIWEIGEGDRPTVDRVGEFRVEGRAIRQVEIPAGLDRVMLQVGANQFYVVDLSDPTKPQQLLKETRHGLLYGDQMMRGLVEDRFAAVHWHVSGTHWFDLKADEPAYSGQTFPKRTGSKNGLVVVGEHSLVTTRGGYYLLDRLDESAESERTLYKVGADSLKGNPNLGVPNLDGTRLFAADRSTGLVTLTDLSDPEKPKLLQTWFTPGNPTRPEFYQGKVVVPDGHHGLMVLEPATQP